MMNCPYCKGSGRMIDKIVYAKNEETGFEISEEFEADCIACDGAGQVEDYEESTIDLGNYDENF